MPSPALIDLGSLPAAVSVVDCGVSIPHALRDAVFAVASDLRCGARVRSVVQCGHDSTAVAQRAGVRALLRCNGPSPSPGQVPVGGGSQSAAVSVDKTRRGVSKRGGARPRSFRRPWGEGEGVHQLAECMQGVLLQNAGFPFTMSTTAFETAPVALVERAGLRNQALFCVGFSSPKDAAVVWRGEKSDVLCTCFESAEDATTLSIGGKSGSCVHARAYLEANKAGHALVPSPLHSAPFSVTVEGGGGSHAVVVWDGMIFTVVTLDKGLADLCLAPGCRVSPHQCGHVRQASAWLKAERGAHPRRHDLAVRTDASGTFAQHLEDLDGGEADDDDLEFLREHLRAAGRLPQEEEEPEFEDATDGGEDAPAHPGAAAPPHSGAAAPPPPGAPVLPPPAAALPPPPGAAVLPPPGVAVLPPPGAAVPPDPAGGSPPPNEKWTLSTPCKRNFLPCPQEIAAGRKWRYTAELLGRILAHPHDAAVTTSMADAIIDQHCFNPAKPLYEPACPKCRKAAPPEDDVDVVAGCVLSDSRCGVEVPVTVGSWTCNDCKMMISFDGAGVGLFVIPRLDAEKKLLVFTRAFCDDVLSYVVTSRSSFSAATRYLASVIPGFRHRRQVIVDLGLMYTSCLDIPALLFRCPKCKDFPLVIIMDGQALGFRIPPEWDVLRLSHNVPVLPLPLTEMTVLPQAAQSALVQRITRNGTKLASAELASGVALHLAAAAGTLTPVQEAAVVLLSFFFAYDSTVASLLRALPPPDAGTVAAKFLQLSAAQRESLRAHLGNPAIIDQGAAAGEGSGDGGSDAEGDALDIDDDDVGGGSESEAEGMDDEDGARNQRRARREGAVGRGEGDVDGGTPDDAAEGTRSLGGGRNKTRKSPGAPWELRKGCFAPVFDIIPEADMATWTSIRWFLRALLGEPVVNLFVSCDALAVRNLVTELRATGDSDWEVHISAVRDVAFVAHFLSRVAHVVSAYRSLRLAIAALFEFSVDVEDKVDARFALSAEKASRAGKGENKEYCEMWRTTSPEQFASYVRTMPGMEKLLDNDSVASMEVFPNLKRCRPGIWDNSAAKRRAMYAAGQKEKRTAASAAKEDAADKCNKNFPTDQKLTPGVYNVLCPHVVSYGFRVLTKAESVEDGISVVLERFSDIPKTIYYDMACKMNRNLMRRVRPLFRHYGVRCFMDRPHGKGHTCSLTNFADASLRQTLGKASTAAEVSHSIAIRFRPMLAYMKPATFLSFKSFQVATANLRAIYRLSSPRRSTESDHINFGEFFWSQLGIKCITADCGCQYRPT